MMGHREPMIDGDEYDALTRWKKYIHFRPGERKRIKRKFNKRVRRQAVRVEGYAMGVGRTNVSI